jgi:uncharacterized protein (TIGR02594 family)
MTAITGPAADYLDQFQARMKAMGVYAGAVDHDWGPGTQSGFQRVFTVAEQHMVPAPAAAVAPPPASPAAARWPGLDPDYAWLGSVAPLPPMLAAGLKELGTIETPGGGNNAKILAWAAEVGLEHVYTADSVPWCGLFMALCAHRAGFQPPANPLWALNWNNFGARVGQPGLGDVLTFTRTSGGHVAMYIGEDQATYHILGGNQSDKVSITRIAKTRLSAARRPTNQPGDTPPTVTPRRLSPVGTISTNEA